MEKAETTQYTVFAPTENEVGTKPDYSSSPKTIPAVLPRTPHKLKTAGE